MIEKRSFPITLVFPPQGHFTQPYLALPALKAWLCARGFGDVQLVDASIESYDHFLSAEYLQSAAERVARRLPLTRFDAATELGFDQLEAYRAAVESQVSAPALITRVAAAKQVLRSDAFFDRDRYLPAVRTLYHALRLVSAAHFPTQLTPHNFTMRYANDRSQEVLAATLDEEENPYIEFFKERLLPRLVERSPRVLGLSVIYGSQLIPALSLGRLVKQALPECHVTAGGGFLAYVGQKLLAAPGMDACLDSLVFHEGEAPLEALCRALEIGGPLSEIGSLGWYDRGGAEARAVLNAPGHPIRLEDAPPPDFDGLPFDQYLSPEVVVPYDVNRGCYYGECTFCTLPTVIGPGYRTRSAQTIAEHVTQLKRRYGTRNFNFITDCMPPGLLEELPQELIDREADIRWWADARVEPRSYDEEGTRRLYASGCRKLLFGFETATPRLLKMMQKGQSLRSTLQVARSCAEAGISVTFYAMVGFPTETREEARATLDVLVQNAGIVREVSLQTFHIDEVAKTYHEPERFGLEILDAPGDLSLYHDYCAAEGMTQAEAAEMFAEMMGGLRAALPIFAGDHILYFMQKSHYFLHLARDQHPDDFEDACRERTRLRDQRRANPGLEPAPDIHLLDLEFPYAESVRLLGLPQARAVRPDFLTGRYDEAAREEAARALGSVARAPRVLAYAPEEAEFFELRADGKRLFDELSRAGSYGALLEGFPALDGEARERLDTFATHLHRLGCLVHPIHSPVPTP